MSVCAHQQKNSHAHQPHTHGFKINRTKGKCERKLVKSSKTKDPNFSKEQRNHSRFNTSDHCPQFYRCGYIININVNSSRDVRDALYPHTGHLHHYHIQRHICKIMEITAFSPMAIEQSAFLSDHHATRTPVCWWKDNS